MSGPFALAAVSAVLRRLLTRGLGDVDLSIFGGNATTVTAHPPDLIQTGANELAQLNLYLYRVAFNGALRNEGLAARSATGERLTNPPLALDLHYLLTAYGAQELYPEALLGYGMQVLHEVPFLSRDFIRNTWSGGVVDPVDQALADSGLADQIEYLKISPETLSTEEISKLWAAFQAKHRPSTAFQVTVALIQAKQGARAPLPVLKQGQDDTGPNAVGSLVPPYPEIGALKLPKNQPAVLLGDQVQIVGHDFAGENGDKNAVTITVRLRNDRCQVARDLLIGPADRDANIVRVQIPNEPDKLPAGLYTISVGVMPTGKPAEEHVSNDAPLLIAPKITSALPATFAAGAIPLSVSPEVRPGQHVSLILGNSELSAQPITLQGASATFDAGNVATSVYRVRLRVDGVESLLIDRSDPKNLKFDPSQQITIS
jgi:hypothetical protein